MWINIWPQTMVKVNFIMLLTSPADVIQKAGPLIESGCLWERGLEFIWHSIGNEHSIWADESHRREVGSSNDSNKTWCCAILWQEYSPSAAVLVSDRTSYRTDMLLQSDCYNSYQIRYVEMFITRYLNCFHVVLSDERVSG